MTNVFNILFMRILCVHFGLFSGEDSQERERIQSFRVNHSLSLGLSKSPPVYNNSFIMNIVMGGGIMAQSPPPPIPIPPSLPPPPPAVFLGYSLPPGHPCEAFPLPPPPADRKRIGPRGMFDCPIDFFFWMYACIYYHTQTIFSEVIMLKHAAGMLTFLYVCLLYF